MLRFLFKRLLPLWLTIMVGMLLVNRLEFIYEHRIEEMMRSENILCYDSFENCKDIINEGTPFRTNIVAEPNYTDVARKNRTEGIVRLRVVFGANGEVSNITPLSTLPDGLTEEAVKAAQKIQFSPATFHGIPISEMTEFEYVFTLEGPFAGIGKYGMPRP